MSKHSCLRIIILVIYNVYLHIYIIFNHYLFYLFSTHSDDGNQGYFAVTFSNYLCLFDTNISETTRSISHAESSH